MTLAQAQKQFHDHPCAEHAVAYRQAAREALNADTISAMQYGAIKSITFMYLYGGQL